MLQHVKTLVAIEVLLVIGLALYRFALSPEHRRVVSGKAVGLTLLTPAVALLSGQLYVYYAYLTVAVAFNSRSRAELSSIYLLMLPMTPVLVRQLSAGGVYLLPWTAVASMNLGAAIGMLVGRPKKTVTRPLYDVAAVLLILMFAYIQGRDVSATSILRTTLGTVLGFVGPYLLVSRGVSSRADLDLSLLRLALAATMSSIVAVFETLRHWVLYQSFKDALHIPLELGSATMMMRGGRIRTGGPILDYSVAGIFFAAVLMTMPYLKSRFRPGWFWLIVATDVVGLVATQSRGAWLGAAIGLAAILAYRGWVARTAIFVAIAAAVQYVVIPALGTQSKLAETLGSGGASVGTAEYRQRLLTRGMEQVWAHPLLGQDQNVLVANLQDMVQGQHIVDFVNGHLFIAMTAGIPWFVVWVVIWSLPIVGALRYRKLSVPGGNPAEVPLAIIVPVMVAIAATSIGDRNLTWPTIALALAGPCFAIAGMPQVGRTRLRPRSAPMIVGLPRETDGYRRGSAPGTATAPQAQ